MSRFTAPMLLSRIQDNMINVTRNAENVISGLGARVLYPNECFLIVMFMEEGVSKDILMFSAYLTRNLMTFRRVILGLFTNSRREVAIFPERMRRVSMAITTCGVPFIRRTFRCVKVRFVRLSNGRRTAFSTVLLRNTSSNVNAIYFINNDRCRNSLLF